MRKYVYKYFFIFFFRKVTLSMSFDVRNRFRSIALYRRNFMTIRARIANIRIVHFRLISTRTYFVLKYCSICIFSFKTYRLLRGSAARFHEYNNKQLSHRSVRSDRTQRFISRVAFEFLSIASVVTNAPKSLFVRAK